MRGTDVPPEPAVGAGAIQRADCHHAMLSVSDVRALKCGDRYYLEHAQAGRHEWDRIVHAQCGGLCLALRVENVDSIDSGARPIEPHVHPLPQYRGPLGFAIQLPALVCALWPLLRRHRAVLLRLPALAATVSAFICRFQGTQYFAELVGDPSQVLAAIKPGMIGPLVGELLARATRLAIKQAAAVVYVASSLRAAYSPGEQAVIATLSDVSISTADLSTCGRTRPFHQPAQLLAIGSQAQRYKGHDTLISALHELIRRGREIELTLVGHGIARTELLNLADRLCVRDNIRFVDAITDRRALTRAFDYADLFVMPSRTEGMPRVLIEAMARALPCVGSRIGGIPELLDEDALVEPDAPGKLADTIDRFLCSAELAERHSARNLATSAMYTVEVVNPLFAEWLDKALSTCTEQ